ncbi:DUF433 domain-containing protein [Deinococcus deserti]|uniref:DUF433 domain-containing protein n=1 Tax=Deinococcus deserti (strain DSM 17065 / CIP 109153 / LMG 22923 / VCD115) TaxID=546414 RepID=X5GY98_DEIDV|nr:DUF433 domain-containing protein [Deinococcus deserti]AHX26569.1 hypothetical protein Deide_3p00545 [Deinococcus deserti VCD115]
MNDVTLAFSPRRARLPTLERTPRITSAPTLTPPLTLTLGRLLIHLDLTPTLELMARIELRGSERRPRVRGKGVAVPDVLRIARRCRTLEELFELRPSLDELDVRACLAYAHQLQAQRESGPSGRFQPT